jgi:pimeloyl-ACP methyl ester carboxylesterase
VVAAAGRHARPVRPDRDRAERDAAGLADPAALTAALTWYRAITLSWRDPVPTPTAPALFVWSDRDTALTRDAAERAPRHLWGPFRYAELTGVSHWIPDEAPARWRSCSSSTSAGS